MGGLLPGLGFHTVDRWNNTAGAIQARYEDQPRVDKVMEAIRDKYTAFSLLDKQWVNKLLFNSGIDARTGQERETMGRTCWYVIDKLIRNFYRDPGTAMFLKMVSGDHSYMHY